MNFLIHQTCLVPTDLPCPKGDPLWFPEALPLLTDECSNKAMCAFVIQSIDVPSNMSHSLPIKEFQMTLYFHLPVFCKNPQTCSYHFRAKYKRLRAIAI